MKTAMMIVMAMILVTGGLYGEAAGEAPPIPSEEQPEVLTRGPVNEAFAQPVNLEIQAGLRAPNRPPADIEEVLPSERPSGDQFSWVPGYWAWDSDRNGYIWVSGCWRAAPPDMNWVPGYWAQADGGWQWAPGFWRPISHSEIDYLPAPPELTDFEAPGPPPSADRMWVPPCWYWRQGQYVRRPGYWIVAQSDWVWEPSHYIRTPRGYVFVGGHWDYTMDHRGVLFAPVYFPRRFHERPRASYGLSITVDLGNLAFSLFARPQYSHYYFGDYYDSSYISVGIFPWFEFEQRHTWYDPIYAQQRWRRQKQDPHWGQHERQEYDRRRADRNLRPPRTYREMESRMTKLPESQRRHSEIVAPITRIVQRKTAPFKFEQIKPEARQKIAKHSEDVHKFVRERSQWEAQKDGREADRKGVEQPSPPARKDTAPPTKGKAPEMKAKEGAQPEPVQSIRGRETEDRKGVEQPSTPARKDTAPPTKGKAPEMKTKEGARPEPVQSIRSREAQERGRENQKILPEQPKQVKAPTRQAVQNQPDKVKVRTSPVVGKQDKGLMRKKKPSEPTEEQKNLQIKGNEGQGQNQKDQNKDKDKERAKDKDKEKDNRRP